MRRLCYFLILSAVAVECLTTLRWVSSSTTTLVNRGGNFYVPSVALTPYLHWTAIDGASWVWESYNWSLGSFSFRNVFALPSWTVAKVTSASLTTAVDDYFSISFNGHLMAPYLPGSYDHTYTYDLMPYLLGSNATGYNQNVLDIAATNTGGPGGLIYLISITLS